MPDKSFPKVKGKRLFIKNQDVTNEAGGGLINKGPAGSIPRQRAAQRKSAPAKMERRGR